VGAAAVNTAFTKKNALCPSQWRRPRGHPSGNGRSLRRYGARWVTPAYQLLVTGRRRTRRPTGHTERVTASTPPPVLLQRYRKELLLPEFWIASSEMGEVPVWPSGRTDRERPNTSLFTAPSMVMLL
jgi:hypothetical protein